MQGHLINSFKQRNIDTNCCIKFNVSILFCLGCFLHEKEYVVFVISVRHYIQNLVIPLCMMFPA